MTPWSMLRLGCEPCLFLKEALPFRALLRDIGRCVASFVSSDFVIQLDLAGVCRTRAVNRRRSRLADLSSLPFLILPAITFWTIFLFCINTYLSDHGGE